MSYSSTAREVFSSSTPAHCYHLGLPSLSPGFAMYLHELSTLHTRWGQQQSQPCVIHMGHVLSNHHSLADYTLPVNVLHNGSLLVYSAKSRFIPELCTLHHILALGNILSRIGTQVSSVSWVSGQGTFHIAALVPFTVGWWSDASNFIFYLHVHVYYSIKISVYV